MQGPQRKTSKKKNRKTRLKRKKKKPKPIITQKKGGKKLWGTTPEGVRAIRGNRQKAGSLSKEESGGGGTAGGADLN